MIVGIQDEILKIHALGLLELLLADKTSKAGIIWATDAYAESGEEYKRDKEMKAALITGANSGIIKNRARKELEQQAERVRKRAEVFTPLPVCRQMLDYMDGQWFDREGAFAAERVAFPPKRSWRRYVDSRRLEITCGEAPYLVQRYDVLTGEIIPLEQRSGILDRKLRVVSENAADENEWRKWALRAYQASYGFDFQGDNVLIARLNMLLSYEDYLYARWRRRPQSAEFKTIANTAAWNIWQMNGLTGCLPYCRRQARYRQLGLFAAGADGILAADGGEDTAGTAPPPSRIYDWRRDNSLEYLGVNRGGRRNMKFDFIIGNPPYQEESERTSDKPVYNFFMDAAYNISDKVELIHPARFLFNAGKTPKAWNQKMLADKHLKVLWYEQVSGNVFPNTDIKGGIAITYRDKTKDFGAIEVFSHFAELESIKRKVSKLKQSLSELVYSPESYKFAKILHDVLPDVKVKLSKGHEYDLTTNIFEKLDNIVFFAIKPEDENEYIQIYGRLKNKRVYRYVRRDFIVEHENLTKWKVFLPKSNGSGAIGESLSTPLCGQPLCGHNQSFISFGAFKTEFEADACLNYIKTKFARTCLGILKITQDNKKAVWKYVPLQDFTPNSDIDWCKSIREIDLQLYAKYGLDEQEIEFIETHVKEMA